MKIGRVGAEYFHADGRTDGDDEADSRVSQFLRKHLNIQRSHSLGSEGNQNTAFMAVNTPTLWSHLCVQNP